MKFYLPFLALFCIPSLASARPSLTVAKFEDKLIQSTCPVQNKTGADLATDIQKQLTSILANYPDLKLMDSAKPKKGSGPRYMLSATLKSFEDCRGQKPSDEKVKVAIEFRVIDNLTGTQAFTYTSSASATGPGVLAETTHLVLLDIAQRVDQALISRKANVKIVDRKMKRQIVAQDYKVKLVHRDPARQ